MNNTILSYCSKLVLLNNNYGFKQGNLYIYRIRKAIEMISVENFQAGTYRNNGDFKSFIPAPINDSWTWTSSEITSLLSVADRELGSLSTFSELIPDLDVYIRMHIRIEANKSNRIEGTKTSIEEDMLPIENQLPEIRNDVQEIENYIKAMEYGIKRITEDEFPFSSRFLRELHGILMQGVRGECKTPGEFRRSQNFIGGSKPSDAAYVPPSIIDLDSAMSDFDKFANRRDGLPVLVKLAIMHYQFETIHPFLDGNGRIGRLMIPLYLLSEHILDKPCFYISDFFESHRSEYYDCLQSARINNDMHRWICFFLRSSIETARKARFIFRNVLSLVDEYNIYIAGKRKQHTPIAAIIKAMYSHPVGSVSQLTEMTGLNIQMINSAVKTLLGDGILIERTGGRRNRIFVLAKYMEVFSPR